MADRNLQAGPSTRQPPPLHLDAAAAYYIIVSIYYDGNGLGNLAQMTSGLCVQVCSQVP